MLPTSFHDVASLYEVSLDTWKSVLTAAGETERLDAAASYETLWQALATGSLSDEFLDALEVLQELGTDAGRDLLANAADDQQVSLGAIDDEPARELVARIWRESRSSTRLAEVLMRARFSAHQATHSREYREYVGERASSERSLDAQRVREAVSTWCRENGKSEPVEVYAYKSGGEWRCEILRGEAVRRVLEIKEKRPKILDFRPGVADHLRFEPETGRLGIATRSPRLLRIYRELVGSIVAGNASFFSSENICTLRPLQESGRALFDRHRPPGILRVDVTELRWRRGDREKVWVKGPDCFRILDDLGARLYEGELIEARLSIWFSGLARRGIVSIKVPGRIEINAGAKEHLVERLLDQVGIRGVFNVDNDRRDLWSLYPWRHDEQSWRRHVGRDFDHLLKRGVFRVINLGSTTHPEHPDFVGALDVEVMDGSGDTIGVSDDPAIPLRTLTSSDVMGFELELLAVVREIASALALHGSSSEIANGLWFVGSRSFSPSLTIAVFLASRKPGETVAHSVRATANGARPVLLVPLGRAGTSAVSHIECPVPSGPYDGLVAEIVECLGLQGQVAPPVYLTEDLILDPKNGTAWYRGVPLTKLLGETHPFRFAVEVAGAGGRLVTKSTLNTMLSPSSNDDGIARKAKRDFVERVQASFKEAGRDCPSDVKAIFASRTGGYVLNTSARVLV